jgi:hypothetical protein
MRATTLFEHVIPITYCMQSERRLAVFVVTLTARMSSCRGSDRSPDKMTLRYRSEYDPDFTPTHTYESVTFPSIPATWYSIVLRHSISHVGNRRCIRGGSIPTTDLSERSPQGRTSPRRRRPKCVTRRTHGLDSDTSIIPQAGPQNHPSVLGPVLPLLSGEI